MSTPATVPDLPHNIEAEQALLGALLVNNEVYDRIASIVCPEDFYDPVHSRIFEVIVGRIQQSALASPITVKDFLVDDPGLAELGGPAYLVRLAGAAMSIFAAPEYAKTVAELSRKRSLYVTLSETAEAILKDPERSVDQALGEVEGWALLQESRNDGKIISFMAAVSSALRQAKEAYDTDEILGVKSGIAALDHLLGAFAPGDMIVVAGRPGMGKSSVALQFALNAARSGHGVGFISLEMTETQLAFRALAEQAARSGTTLPYQDIRMGRFEDASWDVLAAAAHALADLPIRITPPEVRTIGGVMSACRRVARIFEGKKQKLDLLIIDYLQIMEAMSKGNRTEQVTELSNATKAIAQKLRIPVIVLAQLSRAVEMRDDKRPTLSDLRDSGAIEQDADVVIFPYREEYYLRRERPESHEHEKLAAWHSLLSACAGKIDLIVAKQRMGETGAARALFDERTNWLRNEHEPRREPAAEGFA